MSFDRIRRRPHSLRIGSAYEGQDSQRASAFIAGKSDWRPYQRAGAVEIMRTKACTQSMKRLGGAALDNSCETNFVVRKPGVSKNARIIHVKFRFHANEV